MLAFNIAKLNIKDAAVIFGVANKRTIAWAIAKAWRQAGAKLIFNYEGERLKENVEELISEFGTETPMYPCGVTRDEKITQFFAKGHLEKLQNT